VILDEPYSALDEAGAEVLDGELESLAETRTLVVSTHDPARLEALTTQVVALA
jgi:ABC-type multidrug transport system ATPase subunit